jgi:uncharacterized protein (TIGR04222 family)
MRRLARGPLLLGLLLGVLGVLGSTRPADAQSFEQIHTYDVVIAISDDGTLTITETIDYDFGDQQRHGIFRDIPTRFLYEPDPSFDRVYPLEVVSVTGSPGTPVGYEVEDAGGGITRIRIGDPDRTITGRHTYELVYRVEGALNGFADHDELYWNAVGAEWSVPIGSADAAVEAPANVLDAVCFAGYEGSRLPCDRARIRGDGVRFVGGDLGPFEAFTIVVAIPKGAVPDPAPILEERWSLGRAYRVDGPRVGGAVVLFGAVLGGLAWLGWRRGRDRRYRGSPVDQVLGGTTGEQTVPLFEGDASAPVEFAPPEGLRPGQLGTLLDERANTLDVTATIVDLAVRGYLLIQEIPKQGWFGKKDWTLIRLEAPEDELLGYERKVLDGLFRDGSEVTVSSLRTTFVERLHAVQEALYRDAMREGWFLARPDTVRTIWTAVGIVGVVVGVGVAVTLAAFTTWGWLGVPLAIGGVGLLVLAGRMPARTAEGTAMLRRARGFRTVIETAETHMSRWAEKENVFTRYLPYAVVFGLTDKWAKAFADLGVEPDTSGFYVGPHAFMLADFGEAIDGFAITTGGTLGSTPSASGGSGFGGGGSSGGGGGGGGGGSW